MKTRQEEKTEALRVTEFSKLCTKSSKYHQEFFEVLRKIDLSHKQWREVFDKFNEYVKVENERVNNLLRRIR